MVGTLGISFGWSVPGWCLGSQFVVFLAGIALGKTTETQASVKLIMVGSYNMYLF